MTVPGWLIYRTIWRSDMLRLIDVLRQREEQLYVEMDELVKNWPY